MASQASHSKEEMDGMRNPFKRTTRCPRCERLESRIADLEAVLHDLRDEVMAARAHLQTAQQGKPWNPVKETKSHA